MEEGHLFHALALSNIPLALMPKGTSKEPWNPRCLLTLGGVRIGDMVGGEATGPSLVAVEARLHSRFSCFPAPRFPSIKVRYGSRCTQPQPPALTPNPPSDQFKGQNPYRDLLHFSLTIFTVLYPSVNQNSNEHKDWVFSAAIQRPRKQPQDFLSISLEIPRITNS